MLAEAPHSVSAIYHSRPLTQTVDVHHGGRVQRVSEAEVDGI